MDSGTRSLLNIILSVLAPFIILNNCSTEGDNFWEIGTAAALVVALSLPLACGIYSFVSARKVDPITLFGLLGTILTGVVSVYANTGEGAAIRPDTPWWYAAKEATIALLLGGAMLVNTRREGSMLRAFIYSDALFDIKAIEKTVAAAGTDAQYGRILNRASIFTASSLFVSAIGNFCLALYFLLPVLGMPEAEQPVAYNYAVGSMTWWGYLIIGLPLMGTIMLVLRYLIRALTELTGLTREKLLLV